MTDKIPDRDQTPSPVESEHDFTIRTRLEDGQDAETIKRDTDITIEAVYAWCSEHGGHEFVKPEYDTNTGGGCMYCGCPWEPDEPNTSEGSMFWGHQQVFEKLTEGD